MDISSENQGVRHCKQCDYEALDTNDLDAHKSLEHTTAVDEGHTPFNCNFCRHWFPNKSELMKHKKLMHKEKVSACWNF